MTKFETFTNRIGSYLVKGFHLLALFVIGATIVWSATFAFIDMMAKRAATVEDILLLFIYLELGAMVGIYFATKRMPVRFLIYIAITALTRLMIAVVTLEHKPGLGIIYISLAIFILALSVLVIRFGQYKYPSLEPLDLDLDDSDRLQ